MIEGSGVEIEEVALGSNKMKQFAGLPWKIYKGNPHWVPPLKAELMGSWLMGSKGLLTPDHPCHQKVEVTHFLAWRGTEVVGRVAAFVHRHPSPTEEPFGGFGLFEVIDDEDIGRALLDQARHWVSAKGGRRIRGPLSYSMIAFNQGLLVKGFDTRSMLGTVYNHPYYARIIEGFGFRKVKDYFSCILDREAVGKMPRVGGQHKTSEIEIQTRPINLKDMKSEVEIFTKIYNDAWSKNWGVSSISEADVNTVLSTLRFVIDPGLIRVAFANGEPAGVIGLVPDPNYLLTQRGSWFGNLDLVRIARLSLMGRRIPDLRTLFFGIRPAFRRQGISSRLINELLEYGIRQPHYQHLEGSFYLEDNANIIALMELVGCRIYKTWRVYEMEAV